MAVLEFLAALPGRVFLIILGFMAAVAIFRADLAIGWMWWGLGALLSALISVVSALWLPLLVAAVAVGAWIWWRH